MALELRPNCEYCDVDLPPEFTQARICSYECTFCAVCAEHKLHNVCPNCGGGLMPRPIRPARNGVPDFRWQSDPSNKRRHLSFDVAEIAAFSEHLRTSHRRTADVLVSFTGNEGA